MVSRNSQRPRARAGRGEATELEVVEQVHAHRDETALVDRDRPAGRLVGRQRIGDAVAAEHRDAPLVQPRHAGRVQPREALRRSPRGRARAPRVAAGRDEQDVALADRARPARARPRASSSGAIASPGSSQSTPRRRGMSSSTPRPTMPSRAAMMLLRSAPMLLHLVRRRSRCTCGRRRTRGRARRCARPPCRGRRRRRSRATSRGRRADASRASPGDDHHVLRRVSGCSGAGCDGELERAAHRVAVAHQRAPPPRAAAGVMQLSAPRSSSGAPAAPVLHLLEDALEIFPRGPLAPSGSVESTPRAGRVNLILDIFSELQRARPVGRRATSALLLRGRDRAGAARRRAAASAAGGPSSTTARPSSATARRPEIVRRRARAAHEAHALRPLRACWRRSRSTTRCASPSARRVTDILSGGRLELGLARSGGTEWETFGVDPETSRAAAARGAADDPARCGRSDAVLVGERAAARSRSATCVPKPLQKPHPPLWQTCTQPRVVRDGGRARRRRARHHAALAAREPAPRCSTATTAGLAALPRRRARS